MTKVNTPEPEEPINPATGKPWALIEAVWNVMPAAKAAAGDICADRMRFAKAVTSANVPRGDSARSAPHSGQLGRERRANVKAVQRMLGHASAAMTLDLYTDLFDDDLAAVATALNTARADAING